MIYLFVIRKSRLEFHKRIDLNMKEILLVELLLPPQIPSAYPQSSFSFPNISEEDMHQYVQALTTNDPEKNINYSDRINQWDIDNNNVDFELIK